MVDGLLRIEMSDKLPTLRFQIGTTVAPGDRLGNIRQALPGHGTYTKFGHIYASVVGILTVSLSQDKDGGAGPTFVCTVMAGDDRQPATAQVLKMGQIVVGQVVRVTPQSAIVDITVAENVGALQISHEGAIHKEDARSGSNEQVDLADCFHPGDLVVCRVLSLGDSRRYFLSTAEANLGVIRALSSKCEGVAMIPVSFKEMECPETGFREPRKCAKPRTS